MFDKAPIYTKEQLIEKLREIAAMGWIPNRRSGNDGGIGNTLEDLLGIKENNLPIPNASEWELKTQRLQTSSLITLCHIEPSPRAMQFVPAILLPNYGWPHKNAGTKYLQDEMSFRQTINGNARTDRGFKVVIDRSEQKILVSFDAQTVSDRHKDWLESVSIKIGLNDLNPQPYWGFSDLQSKLRTKLLNSFFVQAEVKKKDGFELYKYSRVTMLREFSFSKFLTELDNGNVLVDFDARTRHNHGTKFRLRQDFLPKLYAESHVVVG